MVVYESSSRIQIVARSTWRKPVAVASDFFIFLLFVGETCSMAAASQIRGAS